MAERVSSIDLINNPEIRGKIETEIFETYPELSNPDFSNQILEDEDIKAVIDENLPTFNRDMKKR
jgi:hypothetical protein